MQDEAAFYAALAIYASIWENTKGSEGSALQLESTYYKAECVRCISSRLNGREPPSDGTIYAVIWLWGIEVRTHKSYKTLIAN
jgi:hypothetical protein